MENNDNLKQRLVGAAVLISLVVVFLPMLVDDGPGPSPDRPAVPKAEKWQFSGWKDDQYQPPEQPQRPVVEAIDAGPIGIGAGTATGQQGSAGVASGESAAAAAGGNRSGGVSGDSAATNQAAGELSTTQQPGSPSELLEATVKGGDTLYGITRGLGLEPAQVREVVNVSGARETLSRLRPGQRLRIRVDAQKRIMAMEYLHGGGPALRIKRIGGRLQVVTGGSQASVVGSSAPKSSAAAASQPVATATSKPPAASSKTPRPNREQGPVAWAVRIGVYKDWDAARGVQSTLRSKGYPAFLKAQDKDGSKFWHLKVGPQLKKSDAIALARKIQQETGSKTQVVGYP